MNHSILIIDADIELAAHLSEYLIKEGCNTQCAHGGEQGIKIALNQSFDAIILDINLPNMHGLNVLQNIRKHKDIPMLILTALEDDINYMLGLALGADDYLRKPCSPHALLARLHALLRRIEKAPLPRSVISYHDMTVDCAKRLVNIAGLTLDFTNTEFNILEMLIKSPGQAFSKEELTEYALGRKYTAYDRSIDVHISNLRNKLGDNPTGQAWIKTVRGFGYLFNI